MDWQQNELRIRRVALGLTQRQLAKRIGASHMAIGFVERRRHLSGGVARAVAAELLRLERERDANPEA